MTRTRAYSIPTPQASTTRTHVRPWRALGQAMQGRSRRCVAAPHKPARTPQRAGARRRQGRAGERGADAPANLPDAVFALHGLVDIEVSVRIDSVHGRLRATVASAPDAPVSSAVVRMGGGQKGLFVNSTDLCAAKHRARVNAKGQNGRKNLIKPLVRAQCGHRKAHGKHHRRGGRR